MSNPEVKCGDKIILRESGQGNNNGHLIGQILTVVTVKPIAGKNFSVKTDAGAQYTIYGHKDGYPEDQFSLSDRKSQAEYLRRKAASLKEELEKVEAEATSLEKFASDEEEVAHKLSLILKSNGDEKKIAKILKELKQSNYI